MGRGPPPMPIMPQQEGRQPVNTVRDCGARRAGWGVRFASRAPSRRRRCTRAGTQVRVAGPRAAPRSCQHAHGWGVCYCSAGGDARGVRDARHVRDAPRRAGTAAAPPRCLRPPPPPPLLAVSPPRGASRHRRWPAGPCICPSTRSTCSSSRRSRRAGSCTGIPLRATRRVRASAWACLSACRSIRCGAPPPPIGIYVPLLPPPPPVCGRAWVFNGRGVGAAAAAAQLSGNDVRLLETMQLGRSVKIFACVRSRARGGWRCVKEAAQVH